MKDDPSTHSTSSRPTDWFAERVERRVERVQHRAERRAAAWCGARPAFTQRPPRAPIKIEGDRSPSIWPRSWRT